MAFIVYIKILFESLENKIIISHMYIFGKHKNKLLSESVPYYCKKVI